MKTVFNFSHPLSPAAVERLKEMVGDVSIHAVPLHLDLAQPIEPQIRAAIREAGLSGVAPDYIVPPGFAPAAVLVARAFPRAKIVRLAAYGTPPQWLPAEIF